MVICQFGTCIRVYIYIYVSISIDCVWLDFSFVKLNDNVSN